MTKAANPDFERVVRESFAGQSFMETLGATMELVAPGKVVLTFEANDGLTQQHGFVHAGAGTSVMDSACGYAALSLAVAGAEVLTSGFKVHFLRPASGKSFRAVGQVLKAGRTLTVCEGELFQDGGDAPVAKMSATMVLKTP